MASSLALGELEAAVQGLARGLGAHYTPHAVVERTVRTTLAPLCAGLAPQEVLSLRVLDPAVGSGRFLTSALDLLARAAGDAPRSRRLIATRCLFGVDVDPRAVGLARRIIAEAAGCSPEELSTNIMVGDSLVDEPSALLGIEAFDAVLTNPPWISYSGRQAGEIGADRRRLLAERFASFRRWPTTHGAFLELAAGLLRPGGRAALVVPQQVCHLAGYEATRRAVLARCRFEPPPEPLGEGCFEGVVQPAAVVYLRCSKGGHEGIARTDTDRHGPVGFAPMGLSPCPSVWVRGLLAKLRRHPPAPPGTFRDPGVHTGNSAALLLHDEPGDGRVPVREGRCVHPFRLEAPRRWLEAEPRLPEGHYCRIGRAAIYLDARILVRQTANRPIAARHTHPAHFRNSVLACCGIPGLDDAALVGLLNSTLFAFYHRACHADSGQRAFPQVKVGHLQALPIAREAGALAPLVRRVESLAVRGPGDAELAAALEGLDRMVFALYGLNGRESAEVEEWMRESRQEEGRGRLAAR